jgi:ABC-2 type transport system ATP-binding protein
MRSSTKRPRTLAAVLAAAALALALGSGCKAMADPEGTDLPDGLHVLHRSATGRLQQLILRGRAEDVERQIAACNPVYMDVLPLTLEEIFIYELGGADYEVQNILLS